jgi:hypothetical protein
MAWKKLHAVISQEIPDRPDPYPGSGFCFGWSGWSAEGLVVAGGVDGEFAEEFAGGGVDDADVEVVDQLQDGGPPGWARCGFPAQLRRCVGEDRPGHIGVLQVDSLLR